MVDHKAEAEKIAEPIVTGGRDRALYVAEAQLHATLALVEQQHIANMIAFLNAEGGPFRDVNSIPLGRETVLSMVREGLGF